MYLSRPFGLELFPSFFSRLHLYLRDTGQRAELQSVRREVREDALTGESQFMVHLCKENKKQSSTHRTPVFVLIYSFKMVRIRRETNVYHCQDLC